MSTTKTAEDLAGEAYQIIGAIAGTSDTLWNHPDVQAALTYFSTGWKVPDAEPPLMHDLEGEE